MDEDEIIKALIESLGKEVYSDILSSGAKKLGQALETVADLANTLVLPVKAINGSGKIIEKWVVQSVGNRLKGIDPSDISKTPRNQTFVQAMQGVMICFEEEELREMFANLIAAAFCESMKESAHPSFPTIIEQLSPYEAKLIKALYLCSDTGVIFRENLNSNEYEGWGDAIYFNCLESAVNNIAEELSQPTSLSLALDNLRRLQIISTRTEVFPEYVPEHGDSRGVYGPEVVNSYEVDICFTGMGWEFLECCVSKKVVTKPSI